MISIDFVRQRWSRKQKKEQKKFIFFFKSRHMDKSNGWLMWMKNKCGTVKNEKVTQEVLANFFFICSDEFRWQTGSRSCDRKSYQFFLIYSCGVFDLDNLSKHKQRFYIYHRCMLYLTDPGAPGTFQTWRPQKSLISPSSGELSPLQCCALSEVIRCRELFLS